MSDKKELEEIKLNLTKQLNSINGKLSKIFITENKPLYEKMYNDTYWTYSNSYGGNTKKWTVYIHAKKVDSIWDCGNNGINAYIICDTFQLTSDNQIIIHFNERNYPHGFENKITKKAFTNAVSKMLKKAKDAI